MIDKNKLIGYVQLYFKVIGKKDTYYATFDGDFRKPLTRHELRSITQRVRRTYEKFDKIYSVEFCSVEEWREGYGQ